MKVRWSWLSLPILTAAAACNSIIGFNDLQKVDGTDAGSASTATPPTTNTTATATTTATTPPAATLCSNATAWGTPTLLPNVNSTTADRIASLTSDELTIVFQNSQGSGRDATTNIFLATRAAKTGMFAAPTAITTLTGGNQNFEPSIASDGLSLYWDALNGNNNIVLFRATRTAVTAAFAGPTQLPNVSSTTLDTLSPVISADGAELFMLRGTPPNGARSIFHALKSGTEFAAPTAVAELPNGVTGDVDAVALTADRLTLYYTSSFAGGLGGYDIWTTTRASTTAAFVAPSLVPTLNSTNRDDVGWVSPDNCRLYMSSDRAGNDDIYLSTRNP